MSVHVNCNHSLRLALGTVNSASLSARNGVKANAKGWGDGMDECETRKSAETGAGDTQQD